MSLCCTIAGVASLSAHASIQAICTQRRIGEYIALAVSLRCTSAMMGCTSRSVTYVRTRGRRVMLSDRACSVPRCTNAGWRVRRAFSKQLTSTRTERIHCVCSVLSGHQRRMVEYIARLQCPHAAPAPDGEYIALAMSLRCTSARSRVHHACSVLTLHQRQMESTSRLQ